MEKDEAKANIIRGVNKKLKRRGVVIAGVAAVAVVAAVGILYYMLFVRQTPVEVEDYVAGLPACVEDEATGGVKNTPCDSGAGEIVAGSGDKSDADSFAGVWAYTKRQTINELDGRELDYNQVVLPTSLAFMGSLSDNWHTHVKSNGDGTASLYFYMSESVVYRTGGWSDGTASVDILFGYHLCDTCAEGEVIAPITRIYYLIYDYDNFDAAGFERVAGGAVLLWEK